MREYKSVALDILRFVCNIDFKCMCLFMQGLDQAKLANSARQLLDTQNCLRSIHSRYWLILLFWKWQTSSELGSKFYVFLQ